MSISDVKHQVIPSAESFKFIRAIIDNADTICQTLQDEERATGERPDNECQTITLEDTAPQFRKMKILRKVMDRNFIAAATNRDPSLHPLMNMVKQQKWDNLKDCCGPTSIT